jgi:hypothetical protein
MRRGGRAKLDEHERGELRRRDTGAREFRRPLTDKLVEKPLQDRRLRRSGRNEDQRRQDIRRKPSACRVQPDMAADQKAVIAVADLRDRAGIGGEHTCRVTWDNRRIRRRERRTVGRKGEARLLF